MTTLIPNFPPTARRNYQEQPAGKAYEKKNTFSMSVGEKPFSRNIVFSSPQPIFCSFL